VLLEVAADDRTYKFEAEFKSRSSPKVFEEALLRIENRTRPRDRLPLLVVPYLRDSQLDELQRRRLSGLDLSGNGVVMVPGKLLVYRTGKPNKFPDSTPSKYAYRGATSLVGRVFLCRPQFDSLAEIEQEIKARGGRVVLSTVSKALKRLESDLIVDRSNGRLRLRQADVLLEKLAQDYKPPKVSRTVTVSTKEALPDLVRIAPRDNLLVLSGRSSIAAYAVMGRSEWPVLNTQSIASVLRKWSAKAEESSRFVDVELRQTDDPTVYFDVRIKEALPYASPVQVFLECSAGDKRERETAQDVRELILRELKE
jgi:hypothetical protein